MTGHLLLQDISESNAISKDEAHWIFVVDEIAFDLSDNFVEFLSENTQTRSAKTVR